MKLLRVLFLLFIVAGCSCKENRVIIFLDVSKSRDTTDFHDNLKKINQLFNEFERPGIFKVYPVSNTASLPLIGKEELSAGNPFGNKKDIKAKKTEQEKKWQNLKIEIIEAYENYQKTDTKKKSCIIQTLETAYEQIKDSNEDYNNYVFYFTDLLEDCDRSQAPTGGISLEGRNFMKKDTALARLNKYYQPDFNLASVLGNRLYFITASDYGKKVKTLPSHDLKYFWRQGVLSKLGYTKTEARNIYINPDLPDKLFVD